MDPSYAQKATLTCPQRGQTFKAEVWLTVDTAARPDLAERLKEGTLHHFICPHCGHEVEVGAPVLVFRPHPHPPTPSPSPNGRGRGWPRRGREWG